ncbi:vomeronasal type-2 receptor 116-like [Pseudophryne corroboree]|uniref:vomeronasal type-2 receptor 116-like n=1 Tax=Pseudophryne corroboree TaxID=495146 RepID=UPI0030812D27
MNPARDQDQAARPMSSDVPPPPYQDFTDVFSKASADILPPHREWDCLIELISGKVPPQGRTYPLSLPETHSLEEYIKENLAKGFIQPSSSPAGAGFFFVKKKDDGLRPCIDYRGLNDITVKNRFDFKLQFCPGSQNRKADAFTCSWEQGNESESADKHPIINPLAFSTINRNPDILPNITLGYHLYDSCGRENKAVEDVLQILSGHRETIPNYRCMEHDKVAGFIGDLNSHTTLAMAQLLNVFGYAQVSYGARDPALSDRMVYPHFVRTIHSDQMQYLATVKLLKLFGWNWVGIISPGGESGEHELRQLSRQLITHGICIEFKIKYIAENKYSFYRNIIKNSSTEIIIICGTNVIYSVTFIHRLAHLTANKTFIFPASWSIVPELAMPNKLGARINCTLVFTLPPCNIPGAQEFLDDVNPPNISLDPLMEDIWITEFRCRTRNELKNAIIPIITQLPPQKDPGEISLQGHTNYYMDAIPYRVYIAVFTMAQALYDMYLFLSNNGTRKKGKIKEYRIPQGQCSEKCLNGFRKAPREGYHACCYDCVPCSEGEISNKSDNENCMKCSNTEMPNNAKNQCIAKAQEFLSYEVDMITIVFSGIAVLFSAIIVLIIGIFIYFRNSQIVRANNQNLSFVLLISLKLSLLCVFLFFGRPVDITCMLRQICFGIIFTVAVSSILAKTITVCIAFKATRPGSYWRKWMGVKLPNSLVVICSSVQVLNGVIWLSVSPPFQEFNMDTYPGTIIIQCNEGSVLAFYFMLGYMGFLAAVSFVLAFMVRTLPDIYNEATYITFSMLVFCSVWVCAIPAYLSSRGKHMVIVEVFAILASCIGILSCIFFPKCCNILMRPETNKK